MTATVPGILLTGDTASKPAATAVSIGTLYSDTDTGAVTQSDGATWQPWAGPFASGGATDWAETGDIVAVTIDGAADGGALTEFARGDHAHAGPTSAAIAGALDYGETGDIAAVTLGGAAAGGALDEVARADHAHAGPSGATVTGALTYGTTADMPLSAPGDAEAAGSSGKVSDAGHVHGREAWGGTGDMSASAIGDTAAAGASGKVADAGHRHARESGATITAALDFGEAGDIGASAPADAAAAGSTGEVADAGHKHPRLTERVVYEFVIDGGGSAITTGIKGDLYVPDAFTLTGWTILLDQSGSIVIDVWNDTYANYPPTNADSLNAGGGTKPTVTTTTKNKDTTLTGYDTSIPADSTLRFNVDSITTATRATIALFGYRV